MFSASSKYNNYASVCFKVWGELFFVCTVFLLVYCLHITYTLVFSCVFVLGYLLAPPHLLCIVCTFCLPTRLCLAVFLCWVVSLSFNVFIVCTLICLPTHLCFVLGCLFGFIVCTFCLLQISLGFEHSVEAYSLCVP